MDNLIWETDAPGSKRIVVGRYDRHDIDGNVITSWYEILIYDLEERPPHWVNEYYDYEDEPTSWVEANEFLASMKEIVLDDLARKRKVWLQKNKCHLIEPLLWHTGTPDEWVCVVGKFDKHDIDGNVIDTYYKMFNYDPEGQPNPWFDAYYRNWLDSNNEPTSWIYAEDFLESMMRIVFYDLEKNRTQWLQNKKRHLIGRALGLYGKRQRILRRR